MPLLALWGAVGIPSGSGPLAIWRDWATEVTGTPIDSGHFLAEENPDATAAAMLDFFQADERSRCAPRGARTCAPSSRCWPTIALGSASREDMAIRCRSLLRSPSRRWRAIRNNRLLIAGERTAPSSARLQVTFIRGLSRTGMRARA